MGEVYSVHDTWAYWDGKQAGTCERNGKRYVFWLRDWDWNGLYPVDDDGNDLPRTYDLYLIENGETFDLLDGWDWDAIDSWVAVREPVLECTENQLEGQGRGWVDIDDDKEERAVQSNSENQQTS